MTSYVTTRFLFSPSSDAQFDTSDAQFDTSDAQFDENLCLIQLNLCTNAHHLLLLNKFFFGLSKIDLNSSPRSYGKVNDNTFELLICLNKN